MRTSLHAVVLLTAALLPGCQDDASRDTAAVCGIEQISWSEPAPAAGACAGPWAYRPACRASPVGRAAASAASCAVCLGWDEPEVVTEVETVRADALAIDCTGCAGADRDCQERCRASSADGYCEAQLAALVALRQQGVPAALHDQVKGKVNVLRRELPLDGRPSRLVVECELAVSVPHPRHRAGCVCAGEAPAVPAACATGLHHSAPGLSRAQLADQVPLSTPSTVPAPHCMSCEQLHDPVEKYDCLTDSEQALDDVPLAVRNALRDLVVRYKKIVYLSARDALRPDQDADARAQFATHADIAPVCR